MPSTPSTNLRLELQATGEALNLWGERLNTVISLMEEALVGKFTKALTTSYTLTSTNYVSDEARAFGLFFTDGGLSGVPTITIPAAKKTYLVSNGGSTYNINISCGGTAAAVRPGQKSIVYCDATDCYVLDPTLDKINKAAADVDINSHKLKNVTDPASAQDAATKNYVDTKTLDTFTAPAADVTLNSHKITNLADATANTDAMNKQSVLAQIASAVVNVPVQTGNANKVLTTDGTTPAWSVAGVQGGGTGVATLAAHGVVLGNGTSPVNVTATGTSGQPLVSNGASADPTYQTLPISGGGTGQVTAAAARGSSGLNIEGATGHGDSIYTILATDRYVYTNAAFTGSRTWTLPAANAVNPGQGLIISDLQGTVTNTNTLVVARAGSDTINGASSVTLDVAYAAVELISDGSSKWFARRLLPYGTSANQTLRLDSAGKLPAVDGSQLLGLSTASFLPFGDASDGDVTVSGSLTLSRDMYYRNLTISSGAAISMGGYRIFVAGTLDISAAPAGSFLSNGGAGTNASGTTSGAAGTSASSGFVVSGGAPGRSGENGNTGAGAAGLAATTGINGGSGGDAGAAGAGTAAAGSLASAVSAPSPVGQSTFAPLGQQQTTTVTLTLIGTSGGGASAPSGGGNNSATSGGGSGGGGGGGGAIVVAANIIARGTNSTAAIFQASGGKGGNGGTPTVTNAGAGGGSGGGGGGWVFLLYKSITGSTITNAIDVSGGGGGNGGNAVSGTGVGGNGGSSGYSGMVTIWPLASNPTITLPVAGSAGTAHTTITGGAGAATNTKQVSL